MIQRIQALRIPPALKTQRCREMLQVWVEWGHSEQEIRRLAKGPTALEPEISEKKGRR